MHAVSKDSYVFEIKTDGPKQLQKRLKEELTKQRENNRVLQQYTKIQKISHYESEILRALLRAEGYYGSSVRALIEDDKIQYNIQTGELYRIANISIESTLDIPYPENKTSPLVVGAPLNAQRVLDNENFLRAYIAANYCLFNVKLSYKVTIFHETKTASVVFLLQDSPVVKFGDITFTGLQSIKEVYLRERIAIKKGDCFIRSRIDEARISLFQTNLVASVTANTSQPDEQNLVDVSFSVQERHHRTVSAGAGYKSDEGFGVSLGWEHRNLWHSAQKFTIDTYLAQNTQSISGDLTLPHFASPRQNLTLYSELKHHETDAFESEQASTGLVFERQIKRNLKGTLGSELEFSSIVENDIEDTFALLSFPMSLEYDKRDNPLDSRKGWVVAGNFRPYRDISNSDTEFTKSTFAASAFLSFNNFIWRPTFALRGATGTISGIERDDVPANTRFYVGGGGSVRGYKFQSLGPIVDDKPAGGLSFSEVSMEARVKWGDSWGGVIFLDGGFAYENTVPQVEEDLLWGTGIGIRYYTSFAPIRFDIAVPLNKRKDIDDDFQLYISIGQAF